MSYSLFTLDCLHRLHRYEHAAYLTVISVTGAVLLLSLDVRLLTGVSC
jgi:hypothetical protein